MILAISRIPFLRLARTPRAWFAIAGWMAVAVGFALALRFADRDGVDRFLLDLWAPIAMPLLAMAIVSGAMGPEGTRAFARSVMPFGARGALVAIASIGSSAIASAIACAVTAAIGVVLVRGTTPDLAIAIWVGALGGATYAAYFALGSAFGPKGSGRGFVLFANWFLANAGTAGTCLSPYAQIRSLLGGPKAAEWSQRASSGILVGILIACTLLTAWRCRKR